jgi:hypothetical protein
MLKFHITKRDEREGDGYSEVVEFDSFQEFLRFANYHQNYIEEIRTLEGGE